jgi:outer membrane protein OmpA-like peptidoglycan-associated protein
MVRMHGRPLVPQVERTRPNTAPQPAAPAAHGLAASLLGLQRTAGNRAVGALLARRQPPMVARCAGGRCTCGGGCRTNALEDETEGPPGRAGSPLLQRSVGAWFDAIGETISEGVETVEQTFESAKEKLDTLADLTSFPLCPEELGAALPLPDWVEWLDDEGLEAVRNEGAVLSRTKMPSGGDRRTTELFKQVLHAWGCEKLGRDLLPKHGSGGPFGPETQAAVKQLQLWSWLTVDGVVGPQTLAALDRHVGVAPAWSVPGSDNGSKEQGKSNWSVFRSPAAHIYFSTDESSLDADAERILEAMADHIESPARGVKDITLEVVGYADKRHDALYNVSLSNARAQTVADYLFELLKDSVNVHFTTDPERAIGKGEIERAQVGDTEEELKPFRRVDVYVVEEVFREPPPEPTCLEPTTKWKAQLRNMQGFGPYVIGAVDIAMEHPDSTGTRWMMTYKFGSGGISWSPKILGMLLPSVTGDSGFKPFETSVPLSITEFTGLATYASESVVVGTGYSVDRLWIEGITDHGADVEQIKWEGESSGFSVGIGATEGLLTHFKPCEEAPSP